MQDDDGRPYGRDYEVTMALSAALNFTPTFIQPLDGKLIACNKDIFSLSIVCWLNYYAKRTNPITVNL